LAKKHGKTTAFWQNHGIPGIWRKSRFPWFPCFRDYLLSLMMMMYKSVTYYLFQTSALPRDW